MSPVGVGMALAGPATVAAAASQADEADVGAPNEKELAILKTKIEGPAPNQTLAEYLNRTHVVPIVTRCFMGKDSRDDALDIILGACEKHSWDNLGISQEVKQELDGRLGPAWHVVVGESYSFDVGFEDGHLVYVYYGSLAILAWRSANMLMGDMKAKKQQRRQRK